MVREDNAEGEDLSLTTLKQQRANIHRSIANTKTKLEKQGSKMEPTALECRLEIIELYFKQILGLQEKIERLDPADTTRSDLEDLFVSVKSKILTFLSSKREAQRVPDTSTLNATLSAGVQHHNRLPKLKLPRFEGKYAEYTHFMSTFINLVHDDITISVLDKFNYLLNCLAGPALAVVQPFQISEENYSKALQRLKERYDNKVLIFRDHVTSLFDLPAMTKSDAASLRTIIDTVSALRGSLLSLGSEMDVMNSVFIHVVRSKLDNESKSSYDEKQEYATLPTWEECYKILDRRCQFLEGCGLTAEPNGKRESKQTTSKKAAQTFVTAKVNCEFCNSTEHDLGRCSSFQTIPVSQRFGHIKQSKLCINCLRKGHNVTKCPSRFRCRVCQQSHHTIIHRYTTAAAPRVSTAPPPTKDVLPSTSPVSLVTRSCKGSFIPTALVLVKDKYGLFQPVRALLDSCSELNFMTEEVAKQLQLKLQHTNHEVSGISNIRTKIKHSTSSIINSRINDFEHTATFAITKSISAPQPHKFVNIMQWQIPESLPLADPKFYKPNKIDVLLSTDLFFDFLRDGQISLGEDMPRLVNTAFGWIVGGKFNFRVPVHATVCNVTHVSNQAISDSFLKRFWEIEDYVTPISSFSDEELKCQFHFTDNVVQLENGRLQVRLPFKKSPALLGNSYDIARKRFLSLERRLERDSTLKRMYTEFMREYEQLGHMSKVSNYPFTTPHYVIPHHCVLRPQSESTKLRVVFDASANTSSNYSLNDLLMVGPTIQHDLITTLLAFRLYKYAFTTDISKMYRQFLIDKHDRNYQLILWRNNLDAPLDVFQLNTITYGTSSAPFLAIRCLFHIADLHEEKFPIGAKMLRNDLYVDDVLSGANSLEQLEQKRFEISSILKLAGLQLAKWHSNCSKFLSDHVSEVKIKLHDDYITKALGISWKPNEDKLCFKYDFPEVSHVTKRSILSTVAKIYDILGLLSPIIIRCKILLQELWISHVEWDEPLPANLHSLWIQIRNDLSYITTIEVPRYVFALSENESEIHGFADASQRAYGCCIYIRVRIENSYKTSLLLAKSKVSPIKAQSLPRLELCAAVLLSRTWKKIKDKVSEGVNRVYFWTDSKIVLHWLTMHSSTLNCFVANRVAELQEDTQDICWKHVPSKSNPADIVSRGCSAEVLHTTIWFSGPDFLQMGFTGWPGNAEKIDFSSTNLEQRKSISFLCSNNNNDGSLLNQIIERNSSYLRIIHIFAYVCRVFNQGRSYASIQVSHQESNEVFWRIVAEIQRNQYAEEINCLRAGKPAKSNLQKLAPFIEEISFNNYTVSILRVGGRLANAPIPVEAKFPALLPKDHRFVELYITYLHRNNLHAGSKVLVSLLRQKVWVVNARELTRRVVRNCVHCFRYKPKLMQQVMGNLPADRFKSQRPFLIAGVDFCGPFLTSYRIRGKPPYKTYVAIFVCFASKAIHTELVSDLSTNSFILSLKRFVSRRGVPQRLYCDNATNFVGANSKLKEFRQKFLSKPSVDNITDFASTSGFEFCFIPPRAPHFGGLWEAAVKSTKQLLVKNISQAYLTFEELQTVLIEVEAILNSRPIAPMSDDPNDGEALTPAHLLIGTSLKALPDEEVKCSKLSYLTRWQRITYLKRRFWELWLRDYVLTLQQRSKWLRPQPNIQMGQLVIIHDDNTPPQMWQLARITQIIPGRDGRVRVVDLQTTKGIFRRPITKVAPLPVQLET